MMKRILLLSLILTASAHAQFMPVGFWKATATGFKPSDIDSLCGWYVAADIADSLGKAPGDTTYVWPNRARYLSAKPLENLWSMTAARRPILRDTSGYMVSFDGTDDEMQSQVSDSLPQPNTYFIVCRIYKPATGTGVIIGGLNTAGRNQLYHDAGKFVAVASSGTPAYNTNATAGYAWAVLAMQFNAARSLFRANGTQAADGMPGILPIKYITLGPVMTAGTYPGLTGLFPARMSVRELVVYDGLLTASEIVAVETYLSAKYGI